MVFNWLFEVPHTVHNLPNIMVLGFSQLTIQYKFVYTVLK